MKSMHSPCRDSQREKTLRKQIYYYHEVVCPPKQNAMKRSIRKVAVLGSGVMGSAIACHFANIGCQVLLLDIAPKELTPEEQAKGLTLESKAVKNRIVQSSFDR